MGMSVTAIGGIGYVIDTAKIDNEDHGEHLRELYASEDSGVMSHVIGSYDNATGVFIGFGEANGWNKGLSYVPSVVIDPALTIAQIREVVDAFLVETVFEDGTNASQYVFDDGFGVHAWPNVN